MFPGYLDAVYPLMRDVYVPIRHNAAYEVYSPFIWTSCACLILALMQVGGGAQLNETYRVFLVVASGFVFVFFYQAKFFDYHAVPFGLFLFVAAWMTYFAVLTGRQAGGARRRSQLGPFALTLAMAAIAAGFIYSFDDDEPSLRDRSWAESLDRPTAMAIASGYITGFPLAREIGARWVNSTHCQWSVTYPEAVMRQQRVSKKQRRLFKEYQERELQRIAALVPAKKPEIIIQSTTPTTAWLTDELLKRNPALLDDYAVVAEEGIFRIWRRKVSASEYIINSGDAYAAARE